MYVLVLVEINIDWYIDKLADIEINVRYMNKFTYIEINVRYIAKLTDI